VLGYGDVTRPLFIVADAFSKSAIAKIEAAGGTAQVLEFPTAEDELDEAAAPAVAETPAEGRKGRENYGDPPPDELG
jgi:hypothetical protein